MHRRTAPCMPSFAQLAARSSGVGEAGIHFSQQRNCLGKGLIDGGLIGYIAKYGVDIVRPLL